MPRDRELLRQAVTDSAARWRNEAFDEYTRLRIEFDGATHGSDPDNKDYAAVEENLDSALLAMAAASRAYLRDIRAHGRKWGWYWVSEQLRAAVAGTRPNEAWHALHDAGEALVMMLDDDGLRRQVPYLTRQLGNLDPRRPDLADYRALVKEVANSTPATDPEPQAARHKRQAALRNMLDETHSASEIQTRSVRTFRNRVLIVSAVIGVLVVVAGVVHAVNPDVFSMCARRSEVLGGDLCPSGGAHSRGIDVFAVELMGVLGGLLSAIVPFLQTSRVVSPYRIFISQITIKVMAGALTAFLGVTLLQANLIPGLAVQSGSHIYAYAGFFGLAQQVVTGVADRKSRSLAEESSPGGSTAMGAQQPT